MSWKDKIEEKLALAKVDQHGKKMVNAMKVLEDNMVELSKNQIELNKKVDELLKELKDERPKESCK